MEENGLAAWGRYLKWILWDRWHGESVSAFDTKRASQDEAPGLNLGFVRVTWAFLVKAVLALVALAAVGLVIFLLWQIDWRQVSPQVLNWIVVLVPAFLIFVVGFVAGYLFKSTVGGGGKKDA